MDNYILLRLLIINLLIILKKNLDKGAILLNF